MSRNSWVRGCIEDLLVSSRELSSGLYMRDSGSFRHGAFQGAVAFIEGHGSVSLWAKGLCGWVGKWSAKTGILRLVWRAPALRLEKAETCRKGLSVDQGFHSSEPGCK
jgi:hypothetical protein